MRMRVRAYCIIGSVFSGCQDSMFTDTKPVRGGRKKAPEKANRTELLEKARAERQERQRDKDSAKHAVRVQAFLRGRMAASSFRSAQRADWDRKIGDLGKVLAIFAAQGVVFVPPQATTRLLLAQLLVFCDAGNTEDQLRLQLLAEQALLPALAHADPTFNPALATLAAGERSEDNSRCLWQLKKLFRLCLHSGLFAPPAPPLHRRHPP
jgi:hypothetical protein